MPRKCCVPACKSNYSAGPNVSVFLFPSNEDLKEKWIKAIQRNEFVPSKQSVVCELHFSTDIERSTSMYDSKNGGLLTAPLDRPRLKKDAVPSLLHGCPSYLSRPSASREDPKNRIERVENAFLNSCSSKDVTDVVYPQALNVVLGDDDIHDQNENVPPILFYIGGIELLKNLSVVIVRSL